MNGDNRGLDMTAWNGSKYETISNFYLGYSNVHGFVNGLWMYNVTNSTIEHTRLADMAALNSVTYHANVIATAGSTNITFRYNEITNWQVEGIMWIFGGAANWYIYGNLWHDGMGGASGNTHRLLEAQDGVEGPVYFYNNTCVNINMGVRTANGGVYAQGSQGRNNIYWNLLGGGPGLPSDDYDFSNSSLGESNGQGNAANPFVSLSGQNYHLAAATKPGQTLSSPYDTDYEGNPRGSDGVWDRGAFAFNSGNSGPGVSTLSCTPTTVQTPGSTSCTVTLSSVAPSAGVTVTLSSSSTSLTVPSSVSVPADSSSTSFTANAAAVTASEAVTITASANGTSQTGSVTLAASEAYPNISGVTCNPTSIQTPGTSNCTVTLSGPAPSDGMSISLASNQPALAIPSPVNVSAGASNVSFTANASAVSNPATAVVSATSSANSSSGSVSLALLAAIVPAPNITGLSCNPGTIQTPGTTNCAVTLSGPAPSGGMTILLASNNGAFRVPSSALVASGAYSVSFTGTATTVSSTTSVTVSATTTANSSNASGSVVLNPAPTPVISSLTCNPITIQTPATAACTVKMSASVSTATSVSLSSNNTSLAVPSSVQVPAGSSTATFTATAQSVSVQATAVISATTASSSGSCSLTLLPVSVPGTGALAIDVNVSRDGTSRSSTIATPAFSTRYSNELLLAFVAADSVSTPNISVTSVKGCGLTWTLVARANGQKGASEIWRAFGTSKLTSVSVTATLSQSVVASITVLSFTGADPITGATASAGAASGAPFASLVTTRANSWVFGVGNDWDNPIARVPSSDQNLIHQSLSTTGDTYWVQARKSPTPAAGTVVSISDVSPTSDRYNLAICEVRAAQ